MIAHLAVFLSLAVAVSAMTTAQQWDTFTTNFATDLAPIIVLFGEEVTKQFLSESTSFLDNIIFGVAPLGVITAVVSVIRVYGRASLKAFIGRAQEAPGEAEAQLCSSTSEDVCELWSNGGICRVFGRPRILEFFFPKGKECFYPTSETRMSVEPSSCGIYLAKDVLCAKDQHSRAFNEAESVDSGSNWKEPKPAKDPDDDDMELNEGERFAPYPNMSLNFGIKPVHPIILLIIAVLGIALQLSFFGYATWVTFYYPQLYEGAELPNLWSFCLATSGTALLVLGMILCAMLIERRSTEREFIEQSSKPSTFMFWLQPGGQRVGDQLFNAFAYCEKKQKFVTSWRANLKNEARKHPLFHWSSSLILWMALISSMFGWVCQFVGFRGLHASVALYQLALTLLMAIIRALLRSGRLSQEDNALEDLGRAVEGHELDWQALNLERSLEKAEAGKPSSEHACQPNRLRVSKKGRHDSDFDQNNQNRSLLVGSDGCFTMSLSKLLSRSKRQKESGYTSAQNTPIPDSSPHPPPIINLLKPQDPGWFIVDFPASLQNPGSKYSGVEAATENDGIDLAPNGQRIVGFRIKQQWEFDWARCTKEAMDWARFNEKEKADSKKPNEAVRVMLYRSRLAQLTGIALDAGDRRWDTEVREMARKLQDAIQESAEYIFSYMKLLNNWRDAQALLWSTTCQLMKSSEAATSSQSDPPVCFPVHFTMYRNSGLWELSQFQLEAVLGLWVWSLKRHASEGQFARKIFMLEKKSKQEDLVSAIRLWVTQTHHISQEPAALPSSLSSNSSTGFLQISTNPPGLDYDPLAPSGWCFPTTLSVSLITLLGPLKRQEDSQDQGVLISIPTKCSLLHLVAQDIFTIFISRIADILEPLEGVETGIGQAQTAIIPTGANPEPDRPYRGVLNPHLQSIANRFVSAGLGSQEDALMSIIPPLLQRSKLPKLDKATETQLFMAKSLRRNSRFKEAEHLLRWLADDAPVQFQEPAVRGLGELYRKAGRSQNPSDRDFGMRGFKKMSGMTASGKTRETLQHYKNVWEYFRRKDQAVADRHSEYGKILQDVTAVTSCPPWPQCLTLADEFDLSKARTEDLMSILKWAIQHNCAELIEDLWDVSETLVNKSDDALQTPPFWAVEMDCTVETLKVLLEWPDMNPNLRDRKSRTLLLLASEKGNMNAAELLLERGADITAKDDENRTAVLRSVEMNHEEIVKRLLLAGADPNAPGRDGNTALHTAVDGNESGMVALLLKFGANTEIKDREDRTPLLLAVEKGYEDVVQQLLYARANIGAHNQKYESLLHTAVESNTCSKRMVQLLLKHGVDADLKDEEGRTPLLLAVEKGLEEDVVEQLLHHLSAQVYAGTQGGSWCSSALRIAAERGDIKMVQLLLKYTDDTDIKDEEGRTPLMLAIDKGHSEEGVVKQGYKEVVERLLQARADPNARAENCDSALHMAAQWSSHEIVVLLLSPTFGTDIESRDGQDRTPLLVAVEKGNVWNGQKEVVELLLERNADVNVHGGEYETALQAASYRGQEEIVQRLLRAGADVNSQSGKYGTALQAAAASWGGYEAAKLLLQAKADVNAKGGEYGSPLLAALHCGHEKTMKLLLEWGADTEKEDRKGQRLLFSAIESGSLKMAKTLLEHGAWTEAQNREGQRPLFLAVNRGSKTLVELLLQYGADIEAKDRQGRTPFLLALEKRHDEIAELLLQKGSDVNAIGGWYGCALQAALYQGRGEMADRLKRAGARRPIPAK